MGDQVYGLHPVSAALDFFERSSSFCDGTLSNVNTSVAERPCDSFSAFLSSLWNRIHTFIFLHSFQSPNLKPDSLVKLLLSASYHRCIIRMVSVTVAP